jgi:hypothetical protein
MKTILKNWRSYLNESSMGFDMAKAIMYTAFVLDNDSHQKLAQLAPQGWKVYAHHMTIIPPTEQNQRLPTDQFYDSCLTVIGIAQNERVIAVRVDAGSQNLYSKVKGLPHITIATAIDYEKTEDMKNPKYYPPALSNEFLESDFQQIDPIKVCGNTQEVML